MVLQTREIIVEATSPTAATTTNTSENVSAGGGGSGNVSAGQRPVIDLLVVMIAVPILILCALQLEKHMQTQWTDGAESRWLVFGLGIVMLLVSLLICGYVTHRMGVCLWAGPIEEPNNNGRSSTTSHINSQNDILRIIDTLPPSYDSVVKFDVPPPPYHCVIFPMEQCKEELATSGKNDPIEVVSVHM